MAISASSRMRECGTDWTEVARVGNTILFCHCVLVQPTGELLRTQAALGDTQHGDGRFRFGRSQAQPVPLEKNGGGDKGGHERVIFGDSHRVGWAAISTNDGLP